MASASAVRLMCVMICLEMFPKAAASRAGNSSTVKCEAISFCSRGSSRITSRQPVSASKSIAPSGPGSRMRLPRPAAPPRDALHAEARSSLLTDRWSSSSVSGARQRRSRPWRWSSDVHLRKGTGFSS